MQDLLFSFDIIWFLIRASFIGFWFVLVGTVGIVFIYFEKVRNFFLKVFNIEIEFNDM